jgi:hypothetical protein
MVRDGFGVETASREGGVIQARGAPYFDASTMRIGNWPG